VSDFVIGGVGAVTFVQGDAADYFRPLHGGQFSTADATEAPDRETHVDAAYTGVTVRVDVSANTEDVNHFVRLRINSTENTLAAQIPGNTTGEFSDIDSIAIASGDDVAIKLGLTGDLGHGDAITIDWWSFEYTGTGDSTWVAAPRIALGEDQTHGAGMHGSVAVLGQAGNLAWETAVAATLDNARAVVTQNNVDNASSVRVDVNGLFGNLDISIAANTTGLFSDTVNTDTLAASDRVLWRLVPGVGKAGDTLTIFSISVRSSADAYAAIASYNGSIASASATEFFGAVPANVTTPTTTEADFQTRAEVDETVDRGAIGVTANARTTTTTFTFRDTGVDTNIVLSVAGSTTGLIQDTTNSHTLAAADDINWEIVTGTGTATLDWAYLSVDLPQQAVAVIPPGLGPVVQMQESHQQINAVLQRY